jgi:hypothetical protein
MSKTELKYNGPIFRTAELRVSRDGRVTATKTVALATITAIGDADIDSALAHAMELTGTFVTVSNQSNARGNKPRNYANPF